MKMLLAFIAAGPLALYGQTQQKGIQLYGSCNAVAIGTSDKATVVCNGMSKEVATDLVRLMNSILQRQIDSKKVYAELDQISGAVNKLNSALNPLEGAPAASLAMIDESQSLTRKCSSFAQDWNFDFVASKSSHMATTDNENSSEASGPVDWHEIERAVDEKRSELFRQTLAPRALETAKKIFREIPLGEGHVDDAVRNRLLKDIEARRANDVTDLSFILTFFFDDYRDVNIVAKPNPELLAALGSVRKDCLKFASDWNAEIQNRGRGRPSQPRPTPTALKDSFDLERVARFQKTLLPQLGNWQARAIAQFPDLKKGGELRSVSTALDLSRMCMDFMNKGNEYRSDVISGLKKNSK